MSASPSHITDTQTRLLSSGSQQMLWLVAFVPVVFSSQSPIYAILSITGSEMLRWYTNINPKKSVQKIKKKLLLCNLFKNVTRYVTCNTHVWIKCCHVVYVIIHSIL